MSGWIGLGQRSSVTKVKWITILILFTICLVSSTPRITSLGLVNVANLLFGQQVVMTAGDNPDGEAYYLSALHADSADLGRARTLLARALRFDPDNLNIRWDLAEIYLAIGNAQSASRLLPVDDCRLLQSPLLCFETLIAHSRAFDHSGVIALSESGVPPSLSQSQFSRQADDVVALAYLERARELLAAGDYNSARQDLQEALAKRPGDLYALYHLLEIETLAGNVQPASVWRDRLVHFSEAGLYFSDERLADFAAEAVSQLLVEGVWERSVMLNSAVLLAWREFKSPGTERLLRQLAERYPHEPEWPYLLGEVFQRRGMWSQAQLEYQRAVAADPQYARAKLRMGMICESLIQFHLAGCTWQSARDFYAGYYEANPGDLLVLKKLIEVDRKLGLLTSRLETKMREAACEQLIVAELLSVAPNMIELGPNLLVNNSFEEVKDSQLVGWQAVTMATSNIWDRALFYTELDQLDSFDGSQSARISGLWIGDNPDRGRPSAGFWVWDKPKHLNLMIRLQEKCAVYLFSFYYRTEWTGESSVAAWLNSGAKQHGSLRGEHYLPLTGGAWRHVLLVGSVGDDDPEINAVSPLLRLWGPGQVWFDDVQLRQVVIPSRPAPTLLQHPIIVIR